MKEDSKNIKESNKITNKSEKNKSNTEENVKNKNKDKIEIKYTKVSLKTLSKQQPNSFTKIEKGKIKDGQILPENKPNKPNSFAKIKSNILGNFKFNKKRH